MPLISAVDLRQMIAALGGVDITIGGTTVKGLLRKPDAPFFEAQDTDSELVDGRVVTALVVSGDLSGLAVGAAATVNGESMRVHRYMAESDGSVTRIVAVLSASSTPGGWGVWGVW